MFQVTIEKYAGECNSAIADLFASTGLGGQSQGEAGEESAQKIGAGSEEEEEQCSCKSLQLATQW